MPFRCRCLRSLIPEDEETAKDNTLRENVRQATQERAPENNKLREELDKDLERLGEGLSLQEGLKANFHKYGFTSTAVVFAVETTIGVIINALTKGLKSGSRGVGSGRIG